jgi:transcriptional regulator with XRE-family HTH domain
MARTASTSAGVAARMTQSLGMRAIVHYNEHMSRKVDADPTPLIAARLREERRRRGWSLDQLAGRARVSKAMLSKLERGESSPTATLLGRICGACGLTMSALVALPGDRSGRLVRRAEQPIWHDPQTHYLRRQVSPLSDLPLQLVEVELPAGASVAFPASAYAFIRQLIWVLAGRLDFVEGETVHKMRSGDCLELGAPADCVFRNPGRSVCRYLVALTRR